MGCGASSDTEDSENEHNTRPPHTRANPQQPQEVSIVVEQREGDEDEEDATPEWSRIRKKSGGHLLYASPRRPTPEERQIILEKAKDRNCNKAHHHQQPPVDIVKWIDVTMTTAQNKSASPLVLSVADNSSSMRSNLSIQLTATDDMVRSDGDPSSPAAPGQQLPLFVLEPPPTLEDFIVEQPCCDNMDDHAAVPHQLPCVPLDLDSQQASKHYHSMDAASLCEELAEMHLSASFFDKANRRGRRNQKEQRSSSSFSKPKTFVTPMEKELFGWDLYDYSWIANQPHHLSRGGGEEQPHGQLGAVAPDGSFNSTTFSRAYAPETSNNTQATAKSRRSDINNNNNNNREGHQHQHVVHFVVTEDEEEESAQQATCSSPGSLSPLWQGIARKKSSASSASVCASPLSSVQQQQHGLSRTLSSSQQQRPRQHLTASHLQTAHRYAVAEEEGEDCRL